MLTSSHRMTFSAGIRGCIGVIEMQTTLAELLEKFAFSLPADPPEIQRAPAGIKALMIRNKVELGTLMPLFVALRGLCCYFVSTPWSQCFIDYRPSPTSTVGRRPVKLATAWSHPPQTRIFEYLTTIRARKEPSIIQSRYSPSPHTIISTDKNAKVQHTTASASSFLTSTLKAII
ncbi:hypothetical protein A0H81_05105 [Grifola frondosa]|uniref:Uncharacterized protein n=1 Tax=Grifola frondosa TaxID=5627 RepID=A0A1C7MDF6_GRIFR|nr:hypothetical protein A0H81_05105 [Grifola frondosa]